MSLNVCQIAASYGTGANARAPANPGSASLFTGSIFDEHLADFDADSTAADSEITRTPAF